MPIKHLCVLIHTRSKGEVGNDKPSSIFSGLLSGSFCYLCFTFVFAMLSSLFLVAYDHLLEKLTSVVFPCVLSLPHMVSLVRCDT